MNLDALRAIHSLLQKPNPTDDELNALGNSLAFVILETVGAPVPMLAVPSLVIHDQPVQTYEHRSL